MLRPIFSQAWIGTPQDVQRTYAAGGDDLVARQCGVHAWIFLCKDLGLSERTRALLPPAVRGRSWVFSSVTSQLSDILRLVHRLLTRGISVALVCENARQRGPALWAAYLLWQTQLQLDTVLRVLRDAHADVLQPEVVYMDLLQFVERNRRSII